LASLKATEDYYTTQMEVAKPVAYWTIKGARHAKQAGKWGCWLFCYSALAAPLVLIMYGADFVTAIKNANSLGSSSALPFAVLLTAGLAVATTIAFWIARFLSRLYLSERHMAMDADARAVMARTFLA